MIFILKVLEIDGVYVSDTSCPEGGEDLRQAVAFNHLCPEGYCLWHKRELLEELVLLHGWDLTVRVVEESEEES
jgi:hypothetical protein